MKEKFIDTEFYQFMQNKNCEFFPCHKVSNTDSFNCLFCFCPLYTFANCGGNFIQTKDGIKNCELCTLPHRKENYAYIIGKLKDTGGSLK